MKRKQVVTGVLIIVLSLLLMLQYKVFQISGKYVGLSDIAQLQTDLVKAEAELLLLKEQLGESQNRVRSLSAVENEDQMEELLFETKENLMAISGLTDVTGEGIIVIINDGDRELLDNENPNNLMVHDVDIRNVVDDLRAAGAEAISINGQRII